MPRDVIQAQELKEKGNFCFQHRDFSTAVGFYTQALLNDDSDPVLYSNRANARIHLDQNADAIEDCLSSIKRRDTYYKPHFFLTQARLATNQPEEAVESGKRAYELALAQGETRSLGLIGETVLTAKKAAWLAEERRRRVSQNELLTDISERYTSGKDRELEKIQVRVRRGVLLAEEAAEETKEVNAEHKRRMTELERVFALADPQNVRLREVPDYLIDKITFNVMLDPVITNSGHSFERATIMQYLNHSATDPLTREPLQVKDLRPNLALRDACEEFLKENGWAVDW